MFDVQEGNKTYYNRRYVFAVVQIHADWPGTLDASLSIPVRTTISEWNVAHRSTSVP